MADKKAKGALPQEELDRAVAAAHKGYGELEDEFCGSHKCDSDFKCNEPFSTGDDLDTVRKQECDLHACENGYKCKKPFICTTEHGSL